MREGARKITVTFMIYTGVKSRIEAHMGAETLFEDNLILNLL